MSWAAKRKLSYALVVLVILGIAAFGVYKSSFSKPATCFDGKQDQDETGVDCGGNICALRCTSDISPIVSLWDPRLFNVDNGVYTAAVMVENPNGTSGAKAVPFSLKIYDATDTDVVIKEIDDTVDVYPGEEFPIIETGISTGKRLPGRVVLTFNENAVEWYKEAPLATPVKTLAPTVTNEATAPLVTASALNDSSSAADNVDIVAVVSDKDGNAIGASRTFIQHMDPHQSVPIYFTWPVPFSEPIAQVELYPKVLGD